MSSSIAANGSSPSVAAGNLAGHKSAEEVLASEAARAMAAAWRTGERLTAEELLERYPRLASAPRAALRLISEEICLRQEAGEPAQLAELLSRFPQWRSELEVLFACQDLFEMPSPALDFPQPGERCGEFELLSELGRGSQGRVFLATQPSLCDRPVVVKLTALDDAEHLSLARLQHTGIVPLYLAHDLPDRGLRLLCMPFMGGATFAALLSAINQLRVSQRTGKTIAEALTRSQRPAPLKAPLGGPALDFLRQASYEQAVCWIGACLAEALHYAHQRGLVHFDLKPSNLLLAGDGQPMLLDFHLARGPICTGGGGGEWVGGTAEYMPPEQAAALAAVRSGKPVEAPVDARADVYALGMVLCELLGGDVSSCGGGSRDLRRANRHVARGLADIVAKCLSPEVATRYPDAQALADDLRRQLADLPLRGVANRSSLEVWRKWRRRRPHAAPRAISTSLVCALLLGPAIFWTGQRVQQSQQALVDGQKLLDRRGYAEAMDQFRHALEGLKPVPWAAALKRALRDRLDVARRAQLAHELHQFVERLRFLDGGLTIEPDMLAAAAETCRKFWALRDRLLQADDAVASEVPGQVRADLVDLVVFWLDMQSRLFGADESTTRGRASELLDEAEATLGANEVLRCERQLRCDGGLATADSEARSPNRGEAYALGRVFLRVGNDRRALDQFRRAARDEPQEFWANYYRGRCAYRLGMYDEALNAFGVCVALAPTHSECYYNRALAHTALGQAAEALLDYDRALQLDPTFSSAELNRTALRGRSAE